MEKIYDVYEAIWIAAAAYALQQNEWGQADEISDVYLKCADLVELAKKYTQKDIASIRIYQHCNGDHQKNSHRYLRRLATDAGSNVSFRVTATGEFNGEKECPELDWSKKIDFEGIEYSLEEIKKYIDTTYAEFIKSHVVKKKLQTMDESVINYIGVLEYLENNQEIPYSNPDAEGISSEKRNELLEIKQKGQDAVAEMKKMANRCMELYGLDKCLPGSWLDGSNTKTRKYLWTQMKYKEYEENPISVSLFVENNDGVSKYRISLEIKNDGTDKQTMAKYHSHLDMPAASGMQYVTGSNEWGNSVAIDDMQESIKAKIESGDIRKAQLCIYVESEPGKTNQQYDAEIMAAVKKMIPYYEHVIGAEKEAYWPSLDIYNSGITKEKWLEVLQNKEVTKDEDLRLFKCWLLEGGESTCANVAQKYGGTPAMYNMRGSNYADKVKELLNLEPCDDNGKVRTFPIVFLGRNVVENDKKRYSWKLRDELKEALEDMDLPEVDIISEKINTSEFDKNMILYGPPGTGKTYKTAIYAVAICDRLCLDEVSEKPYSEVMERYKQLKEVEKRVAFTTFHQSYGYEEFIEGIKPKMDDGDTQDVEYAIKDGVFKTFCDRAGQVKVKTNKTEVGENACIWNVILGGTAHPELKQTCFKENTIRIGWSEQPEVITEDNEKLNDKERRILLNFQDEMEVGDIVVTRYNATSVDGIGIVKTECIFDDTVENYPRKHEVEWIYTGAPIEIISLNADKRLDRKSVYPLNRVDLNSLLGLIPDSLDNEVDVQAETKPYVFIIDEINRGNISKIFGELITLIEPTKRKGSEEAMEAVLPYSIKPFGVPNNVYIIGTMNTADRSIALMDTALRRRFQFEEMMPDAQVLKDIHADIVEEDGVVLNVANMLDIMNRRIEYLYDREHMIGHAFFTGLKAGATMNELSNIFKKSVIPLLQEYFYEDYEKIRLVLGDNAKKDVKTQFIVADDIPEDIFEGDVSDEIDIPEKSYTLAYENFKNIMAYKGISKNL